MTQISLKSCHLCHLRLDNCIYFLTGISQAIGLAWPFDEKPRGRAGSVWDFSSAWSRSHKMSSMSSSPIDKRIMSGVMPPARCSSSLSCWCVVLAGWITSDLASPTLARWLNRFRLSMKFAACQRGVRRSRLDAEREHRACALRQILLRQRVVWAGGQGRVLHPAHRRCCARNSATAFAFATCRSMRMPERLQPLQEQERVERAERRAHVAQSLHARLDDVGDVAEGFRRSACRDSPCAARSGRGSCPCPSRTCRCRR